MIQEKRVIALGFFDGVHIGHGALLRRAAERAEALNALPSALTFDRSPRAAVEGSEIPLLTTAEERARLMKELYGIAQVDVLTFDRGLMELPWERFVTDVLRDRFHAVHVVAGQDYRFGCRGEGTAEKLRELCGTLGIGCDVVEQVELDGTVVSSTHIRALLAAGDAAGAGRFLGHPYALCGTVVRGRALGRTIGIPTANLAVPEGLAIPARGVYAARAICPAGSYVAVTNVGVRPTVQDGRGLTVESWLPDFSGELYDLPMRVEFYEKLREERKFSTMDELREEILRNAQAARARLSSI